MKILKVSLIIIILLALSIPSWFVYTRFCLPQYKMDADKLTYKNNIYIMQDHWSTSDEENLGKAIGIGVDKKRTLTDLIWPFWVIEYKNDKEHNSLYLRGLMGSGGKYNKISK